MLCVPLSKYYASVIDYKEIKTVKLAEAYYLIHLYLLQEAVEFAHCCTYQRFRKQSICWAHKNNILFAVATEASAKFSA